MNIKNLKKGEILSESSYYTVDKVEGNRVHLITESGHNVTLGDKYVENLLNSASQYKSEVKKTKTELAQIFQTTTNVAMSVNFNKQPEKTDIVNTLKSIKATSNFSKIADDIIKGEERTMIGRHNGEMNELGRIQFTDLEATGMKLRQVDPRQLNWIITKNVKYSLK